MLAHYWRVSLKLLVSVKKLPRGKKYRCILTIVVVATNATENPLMIQSFEAYEERFQNNYLVFQGKNKNNKIKQCLDDNILLGIIFFVVIREGK